MKSSKQAFMNLIKKQIKQFLLRYPGLDIRSEYAGKNVLYYKNNYYWCWLLSKKKLALNAKTPIIMFNQNYAAYSKSYYFVVISYVE